MFGLHSGKIQATGLFRARDALVSLDLAHNDFGSCAEKGGPLPMVHRKQIII